jgi:DNA-binding CsgD family transcriptional regulator
MTAVRLADRPPLLTEREQRVLAMIAEGREVREMARELAVAERTVKGTISIVLMKLGARNRPHAVALGVRAGYLAVGDQTLILAKHYTEQLERELREANAKIARARKDLL